MLAEKAGIGGCVFCFIPARDEAHAKERLMEALEEDRYELRELDYIVVNEDVDWGDEETNEDFTEIGKVAGKKDMVLYSEFYCYHQDDG